MPRRGAAAPLLAMTCKNLPPVRTIPGHCRCTAGKRPYNRRRVAVFSMSLRASAHTGAAIRIPAEAHNKIGSTLGKSVALFRIRPKRCSLPCPAARSADCHVASLLAMTCRNLPGVCVCKNVLPWQIRSPFRICPKYYSPLCPAARRTDCHVASLLAMTCRNLPGVCVCKNVLPWQIRSPFRICPKYYSPLCPAARRTDCHVASLLAMTCRNLPGVCVCKNVLPWQIRSPFRIRPKYYSPLCPAARRTDCPVASLLAMTEGGVLANRCKMGTGAHLCGPEKAMQRSDLSPGFSGGKAGAKDTQLVSPRCGNPHPRRET